jgi:hypothetical protein
MLQRQNLVDCCCALMVPFEVCHHQVFESIPVLPLHRTSPACALAEINERLPSVLQENVGL